MSIANALPGIVEATSYGLPDDETGERLVLAVHVLDPQAVTFDDVVQQLRGRGLATWKLPEQIVVWDGPSAADGERQGCATSGRR